MGCARQDGRWSPPDPASAGKALCLDGDRDCPPEDCGGASGYDNLLKILASPKHKERKSMLEWLGGSFDPETFDARQVNIYLRNLKWPRTTEGQPRKGLTQQHG